MILNRDPLMSFLKKELRKKTQDQLDDKKFLIILPDDIAIKNLTRALSTHRLSFRNIIITTFDSLAERILDPERKRITRLLDEHVLTQLMIQTIQTMSSGPLTELKAMPLDELTTQEALMDELNEYFRATDAGTFSDKMLETAKNVADPFAMASSTYLVESFNLIEKGITAEVESIGDNVYFSRGHLIKRAREALESSWPPLLEVDEVLISNISVFDASVLKLIEQIDNLGKKAIDSFKIRIFLGIGTYRLLVDRLTKARIPFEEEKTEVIDSEAKCLNNFSNADLRFIAAPERRREIIFVANKIKDLLVKGVHPSEILLVARNCGSYLNLVSEIFPAYGIAYHVQTRRPYAHLPPYRFLKATTELIVAAQLKAINWDHITDPLRLGFCLPHGKGHWPVQPREFIYLEETLSRIQSKNKDTAMSLQEWQIKISSELRFPPSKAIAQDFLQWVTDQLADPPNEPREARYLLGELLDQFMFRASVWIRKTHSMRIENPERFKINEIHPTYYASRIKSNLYQFESYLNDSTKLLHQTLNWQLIDKALGLVLGKETYGLPRQDVSSVAMIDAANASFLETKYLFIMGLRADEFPRRCPKGIFLPEELRNSLVPVKEGETAYLYLRNSLNDYANECDIFENALRTNPKEITFLMPYHDEKNHVLAWSPFVDKIKSEKNSVRILPNEWLPPVIDDDWKKTAISQPPWIRHRLHCFNTYRAFPNLKPKIDDEGLEKISSTIDPTFYHTHLQDRIKRYIDPPYEIEVYSNEECFTDCSLEKIFGTPLRAHEMDLHALCPLQLYFYQILFLWDGSDGIDRDTIPVYYKTGHWRFGKLPRRLSYIYPSTFTNQKIKSLINSLPNRQKDLTQFSSEIELQNHLKKIISPFDFAQLGTTIVNERALVLQEQKDNIKNREWNWIEDKTPIQIEGIDNTSFILPPHRLDILQFNKKFIVNYVNFSNQVNSRNSKLIFDRTKGEFENATDPLRDYRLPLLLTHYLTKGTVAAAIYIELFNEKRYGYYNEGDIGKHKGRQGYQQELKMPPNSQESKNQILKPLEWSKLVKQFRAAVGERAKKMAIENGKISFKASPSTRCSQCAYNNLCQIPRKEAL